jgi:hypothetical protein
VLLGFAVHDVVSLGWRISTIASRAPRQFRDALVEAVAWGIQYKEWATVVVIVCLVVLYIDKGPTIKIR